MKRPSAVRYTLTSGLALSVRSPCGIFENPNSFDATTRGDTCHMAVASREQSTTAPSPVRSRCTRAAAMPPAVAMPAITSPNAGDTCPGGHPPLRSGMTEPTPPRAQYEAAS
jgi:hypothetical protein